MVSVPVSSRAPLQDPEAEQLVAFVTDQVSVVAAPRRTAAGLALKVMTGWGAVDVIATCALRSPPAPLQVRTKVADAVGVTVSWPEVDLEPVQPLLAVHEVAFEEDQLRIIADPSGTEVRSADKETVGAGLGGVEFPSPPPPPPQAASNGATRPMLTSRRFDTRC